MEAAGKGGKLMVSLNEFPLSTFHLIRHTLMQCLKFHFFKSVIEKLNDALLIKELAERLPKR